MSVATISAVKQTSRFEWIDFLRGISALAVVLHHSRVDLWVGWQAISSHPNNFSLFDRAIAFLSLPLPFLDSAVMMFFLVSGFCIHYPYAAGGRDLKLKPYSIRRFLRIYPPYLAVVALGVMVEWVTSFMGHEPSKLTKIIQSIFMLQNYASGGQMVSNPSLWSLPVEVELYFAYPIFYWLLMRMGMKMAMTIVAGFSIAATVILLMGHSWTLFNFFKFWIIWCGGALLAEWTRRDRLPKWHSWYWSIIAFTISIAIAADALNIHEGIQHFLWSGAYFLLMLWGLTHFDPLQMLGNRTRKIFLSLGLISYSLYLVHFPFFKLCAAVWLEIFGTKPANLIIPLIFSILSIPLAYIFYQYFELPSHKLAQKLAGTKKIA